MLKKESDEKQQRLENCLYRLSKKILNEEEVDDYLDIFQEIYSNRFRHRYNRFFAIVTKIGESEESCNLLFLTSNIEAIIMKMEEEYSKGCKKRLWIYKPLFKLSDHLNLEIARYDYYYTVYDLKLKKMESDRDKIKRQLNESYESLRKAEEKLSGLQKEIITIMGIFSAIVVGGVGSFSGVKEIFSNLDKLSIYKFYSTVAFFGIITFNIAFMMIYMIGQITGKKVHVNCNNPNRANSEDCVLGSCSICKSSITRIKNRLPYVFWANIIFLIIMVLGLSLEYLIMKYPMADWLLILLSYLFIGLSVYYGIKNSKV